MDILRRLGNTVKYVKILVRDNKAVVRNLSEWSNSIVNPQEFYLDAFRFYYFNLPSKLKLHKKYFSRNSRGFGEKAFHTMWFLLYKKYAFSNFLEIGIYRGQIISLVGLLANIEKKGIYLQGISPFDNSGDLVSEYIPINYMEDVITNFEKFSLQPPNLLKALSTDIEAHKTIASRLWDCIYIDGSHDYDIVKQDWDVCSRNLKQGGIIVLDDAALNTNYNPPFFAFPGHPGPSRLANEIENNYTSFKEVLRVGHNRVFEKIKSN